MSAEIPRGWRSKRSKDWKLFLFTYRDFSDDSSLYHLVIPCLLLSLLVRTQSFTKFLGCNGHIFA